MSKTNPGWFKKGQVPWSKGTKGLVKTNSGSFKKGIVPWSAGKKLPSEFGLKISLAKKGKPIKKRSTSITDEERRRMSEAQKRRWANASPELIARQRELLAKSRENYVYSAETREKIRLSKLGNSWNRGKKHTLESRLKRSIALTGRVVSEATKEKLRIANSNPSEETRRKIGEKSKGRIKSPEALAKMSVAMKGKPKSLEHRRKMSLGRLNSPSYVPRDLKGFLEKKRIRKSLDSKLWREEVFKRDDWTCRACYKRGGKLQPHHIQNFAKWPELRFVVSNGIALCFSCHKEFHHKYGNQNNNKEQLDAFLLSSSPP